MLLRKFLFTVFSSANKSLSHASGLTCGLLCDLSSATYFLQRQDFSGAFSD